MKMWNSLKWTQKKKRSLKIGKEGHTERSIHLLVVAMKSQRMRMVLKDQGECTYLGAKLRPTKMQKVQCFE